MYSGYSQTQKFDIMNEHLQKVNVIIMNFSTDCIITIILNTDKLHVLEYKFYKTVD